MPGHNAQPDEMPLRSMRELGRAVGETIHLHEQLCPARQRAHQEDASAQTPALPRRRLEAIPFDGQLIPDPTLAQMVEVADTEPDVAPRELAERFGLPEALIERELPLYRARYRRWIRAQVAMA